MRITPVLKNKEIETVQEEENSAFDIFGSRDNCTFETRKDTMKKNSWTFKIQNRIKNTEHEILNRRIRILEYWKVGRQNK